MGVITFYIQMIKTKTSEAYATKGLEGAIKKFEVVVGLILLVSLLGMTVLSVSVNMYVFIFFFMFFLLLTWLFKTERISFLFLGIPYWILFVTKFASSIIMAKKSDDSASDSDCDDEYVEFRKIANIFVTAVLLPILILISVFVWLYFVSSVFDFLVYLLELIVEIANKYS